MRWAAHARFNPHPGARSSVIWPADPCDDRGVELRFQVDDLSGVAMRGLIRQHLEEMAATSPPESCHALDVDALLEPGVTVWSAWDGDALAGCGALKRLDAKRAEIKSMRASDAYRGRGVGRAILEHLLSQAKSTGYASLWLETGSGDAFQPALRLYASAGFVRCPPFETYVEDPFLTFMTLVL
jgi:putative acetyltransferase